LKIPRRPTIPPPDETSDFRAAADAQNNGRMFLFGGSEAFGLPSAPARVTFQEENAKRRKISARGNRRKDS